MLYHGQHLKTFRELYCASHRIPHEKFERALVFRSLHWQAKPFWWLLWFNSEYYSADFEFVRGVGELRSRRDFRNEAADFHYHPGNRGIFRTLFRMRISTKTLQSIFDREIANSHTNPPMPIG